MPCGFHECAAMKRMLNWAVATCLLSMSTGGTSFAGPPKVRAETAEPVLEELMGGCSLKCAFPWRVEIRPAGGTKYEPLKVLNDSTAHTVWMAPEGVDGKGVRFRFLFPAKIPTEMEGAIPLYGLDVINGAWPDEAKWKERSRIKLARIYYNGKPLQDVSFADSRRWEKVILPDIMIHSGDTMELEVLQLYPGTKGGLAITEFVLQGAH